MSDHHCIPECTEQGHIADTGRHWKWQRVEPGTVIPAGQPMRYEYHDSKTDAWEQVSAGVVTATEHGAWFIDSSWKPPLVLPTERTWGLVIPVTSNEPHVGHWFLHESGDFRRQRHFVGWRPENIVDFIPLTDEQVARIEAAR